MRPLLTLVILGTAITAARGRVTAVTPGLCFELRLSTGGRYQKNLAHQLEAIGPLLAAGVRQQPAAIVDVRGTPLVAMLLLAKSSYLVGNPASTFSIAAHSVRRLYGQEASSTLARDLALTSPPPDRV